MRLVTDPSFRFLAARYLRKQIKQLAGQIEGIQKASDIEFIHRARVASRRLRAGLRLFAECFPARQARAWRKQIRRLTRSLGEARDKDVQIALLCEQLAHLPDQTYLPGVARVLASWQRQREKLQPKVIRTLQRFRDSGTLRQMQRATKGWRSWDTGAAPRRLSPLVFAHAEQHIVARLERLRSFEPCLADAEDCAQHHAMRIAAKRLRYTVEICRPMYAGRLDGVLEAIKQVQSLLGDIHDCDIWVQQLEAFVAKQAKRFRALYGGLGPLAALRAGIDYLRDQRRARRQELFATLVQYWQELTTEGLWDRLAEAVRTRRGPARRVQAPSGDGQEAPGQPPSGKRLQPAHFGDVTARPCNPARS